MPMKTTLKSLRLLLTMAAVAAWGLSACGAASDVSLRFDGLYCSPSSDYSPSMCLRFYQDQTVQGASTMSTPEQAAQWLDRSCSDCFMGTWILTDQALQFTMTSSDGSIEFQGTVGRDQLDLNVHSFINGNRFIEIYSFSPQRLP